MRFEPLINIRQSPKLIRERVTALFQVILRRKGILGLKRIGLCNVYRPELVRAEEYFVSFRVNVKILNCSKANALYDYKYKR